LRAFLRLAPDQGVPDHSSLSRTRHRIDLETHREVFEWVLSRLTEYGLLKGKTVGVDASTMEANAAMRSIVRREDGATYQEFLTHLAQDSGIETPTRDDLARLDRQRKGKKVSNEEWHNPYDPDVKITKMKDGRTHLAYKNEHAVDLDTGAIIAAEIHPADQGDTTTGISTLAQAVESLEEIRDAEDTEGLTIKEMVADKGYHSGQTLVDLEEVEIRPYIAEPKPKRRRWAARDPEEQRFKDAERRAVYNNRRRLKGQRSKSLHRRRGERVERIFAHVLDDGGMRRAHLRGRENLAKRYLIQVAAFNLGLILRKLCVHGTPRQWADALRAFFRSHLGWMRPVRRRVRAALHNLQALLFTSRAQAVGIVGLQRAVLPAQAA
jgi:transposase